MSSSSGRRQRFAGSNVSGMGWLMLLLLFFPTMVSLTAIPRPSMLTQTTTLLTKYAVAAAAPILRVIQVYPPVLTAFPNGTEVLSDGSMNFMEDVVPSNGSNCIIQQTLMVHEFVNSYGMPFVGKPT